MGPSLRKLLPALAALAAAAVLIPAVALGSVSAETPYHLAGTWTGKLEHGMANQAVKTVTLTLSINKSETGGTWYVNRTCQGTLSDDGISGGYHHYGEVLGNGSTCVGGAVDCLWLVGGQIWDNVTSPAALTYSTNAYFTRVKAKKKKA